MLANDIVLHHDEFWKDSKNAEQFKSAWNLICRDYAVANQNVLFCLWKKTLKKPMMAFIARDFAELLIRKMIGRSKKS